MKHYQYRLWFVVSIVTSILFSIVGLKLAFQDPYTIQDDARQHIFWMQQFRDSTLFSNDLIADYFKSVAPAGFTTLYRLVSNLGIDIFFFNKVSPLLIGLVTTIYCFGVCLEVFSVPFAAFLSTLLLNQNLWMLDDLSSGTPRAFIYPLLLAFIYYVLRKDLWLCLLTIVLQGLFYPQAVLISATVLLIRLLFHEERSDPALCACACGALPEGSALPEGAAVSLCEAVPFRVRVRAAIRRFTQSDLLLGKRQFLQVGEPAQRTGLGMLTEHRRREKIRYSNLFSSYYIGNKANIIYYFGLIISAIILTLYYFKTSSYEPIVNLAQAQLMPEFAINSRSAFFTNNTFDFWLFGRRTGWLPIEWQYTLICSWGIIVLWLKRYQKQFLLVKKINYNFVILLQIIIASTILFLLAHLFLFRLHLPSRYIHHSLRIVLAILDAIAIAIFFNKITNWLDSQFSFLRNFYKSLAVIILVFLLLMPTYAVQSYPHRLGYITGKAAKLYQFLQQQPTDYLIATLSKEADNIPSFTARSVLVAEEYAIPYHQGYYQQIHQRVKDLIAAQYSLEWQIVTNFIDKYGIDLWLIDTEAFSIKYLNTNQWLQQFSPETTNAISVLKTDQKPIVSEIGDYCTVFQTQDHLVWETDCLLKSLQNYSNPI